LIDKIEFKELSSTDINKNLLDKFNRYQKVTRHWQKVNEEWVLIDGEYVDDWDKEKKDNRIKYFSEIIDKGNGNIFVAMENQFIIGFAVLLNERFGVKEQYIQLKYLHVSLEYRHKGIGKRLFQFCIKKSKEIGVEKIYISANDSEETQKFYLGIGCKDAFEINQRMVDEEPYDRQMEYIVK
jgi:N-acetylglutamate synthase-like GNAT family acetyltransferase